jgi:hypothetical protein
VAAATHDAADAGLTAERRDVEKISVGTLLCMSGSRPSGKLIHNHALIKGSVDAID